MTDNLMGQHLSLTMLASVRYGVQTRMAGMRCESQR